MTGREWWDSVREAASEIGRAEARLAALREPRGAGAPGAGGGVGDPTGRTAAALADCEAQLARVVRELEGTVGDGLAACARVGAMMGQLAASVMEGRYVDCLTWAQVAEREHISPRSAYRIRDRALELTEAVGVAHLVHGWDYEA